MTRYEMMKTRLDNLDRGLMVREMSEEMFLFWNDIYNQLVEVIENMTMAEAIEEV